MTARFRPLPYAEWRDQQLHQHSTYAGKRVDCLECENGTTECCECGQYRECEDCDGTGSVLWDELTNSEKLHFLTLDKYHAAVVTDAAAWSTFLATDVVRTLFDAGFRVWMQVHNRTLQIGGAQ